MNKCYRIIMRVGWFATIGNLFVSIVGSNHFAMIAWIVALCWFPYDTAFAKREK